LVVNIRETDETLSLATNRGTLITNLKADVPSYGTAWYHPEALTNIFSFANMTGKHPISYNQATEFTVEVNSNTADFKKYNKVLYCFKPTYNAKMANEINAFGQQHNLPHQELMDSVEENKMMFTTRQVERGKKRGYYTTHCALHQSRTSRLSSQ
jgi:hypothetical protein